MKEDSVNESPIKDLIISLLKLILVLIVFVVGVVIGLASSSNSYRYFTFQADRPVIANYVLADTVSKDCGNCTVCEKVDCLSMGSFVRPKILLHGMSDDELFWRASLVPYKVEYPFKRVPKVAFMFLTKRGQLPLLPLWERFFQGQDVNKYSIYVYAPPGYVVSVSNTSAFYDRQIPSQHAKWGSLTLVDAEKRVLANALLDVANERFVLLSESCIPIYYFPTVYEYLTGSIHSFVETYDDAPDIQLSDQRRALQCFELNRKLAVRVVSDTKYYNIFNKYFYPDEHYISTYIRLFYGPSNANRTVTYVNWSLGGAHPATFSAANITEDFIKSLRNNGSMCSYNLEKTHICYLFARDFNPTALEPLLNLSLKSMNF